MRRRCGNATAPRFASTWVPMRSGRSSGGPGQSPRTLTAVGPPGRAAQVRAGSAGNGGGGRSMDVGMVGLGRMGGNMAERLVRGGHRVVGFARHPEVVAEAVAHGV